MQASASKHNESLGEFWDLIVYDHIHHKEGDVRWVLNSQLCVHVTSTLHFEPNQLAKKTYTPASQVSAADQRAVACCMCEISLLLKSILCWLSSLGLTRTWQEGLLVQQRSEVSISSQLIAARVSEGWCPASCSTQFCCAVAQAMFDVPLFKIVSQAGLWTDGNSFRQISDGF